MYHFQSYYCCLEYNSASSKEGITTSCWNSQCGVIWRINVFQKMQLQVISNRAGLKGPVLSSQIPSNKTTTAPNVTLTGYLEWKIPPLLHI